MSVDGHVKPGGLKVTAEQQQLKLLIKALLDQGVECLPRLVAVADRLGEKARSDGADRTQKLQGLAYVPALTRVNHPM